MYAPRAAVARSVAGLSTFLLGWSPLSRRRVFPSLAGLSTLLLVWRTLPRQHCQSAACFSAQCAYRGGNTNSAVSKWSSKRCRLCPIGCRNPTSSVRFFLPSQHLGFSTVPFSARMHLHSNAREALHPAGEPLVPSFTTIRMRGLPPASWSCHTSMSKLFNAPVA